MQCFALLMLLVSAASVSGARDSLLFNWLGGSTAAVRDHDEPWFCHNLDCPRFEVKKSTEKWEEREYEEANWVGTHIEGNRFEIAITKAFTRLYKYIDGNNLEEEKINMTAPVAAQFFPEEGFRTAEKNFTVAFFLPFAYQKDPPKPRDRAIVTHPSPKGTLYVKEFGGFATEQGVLKEAAALASDLEAAGKEVNKEWFYFASYDPPYRVTKRHNEVWMLPKDTAATVQEA